MSLLKKCIGLDPNIRKPLDIGLIWEGNYWDDKDVHDCCDVDWETCEILVRKIAKALVLPTSPIDNGGIENKKILIFLPKVMQLPLTILAAYRVGLIGIVMDPLVSKNKVLEKIIMCEKPRIVVTVDAVWQAQELIEIKSKVENICGMDESQLLVIRHVAPNHGIPPPKKHYPARRPSYRTTLDLRNGKDWEWSTIMAEIKMEMNPKIEDSEFNWENEDIVMKLVDEKGKAHPVSKAELLESLESRKLGLETRVLDKYHENHVAFENVLVLDAPQDLETIVNLLLPWYMGKTLTLFEGPLNYPDSSRLAQIISKHNVDIVLGSDYNYSIPNPEYLKLFPVPSLKLVDLPNFESISNYLTISR